jgi:hypothetical protein
VIRRPIALVVFVTFVVAPLAGCGDDETAITTPTSAPLTRDQAGRLADILFDNLDDRGARFTISARTAAGDTMTVTGEVDWVAHTGRADVVATGAEADLAEIVWTETVILERRPSLLTQLSDAGNLSFDFVARAPSPATRTIDRLVAVVAALAGDVRDNPLLIQQEPGSASFGTTELAGREVEILRYGNENRYWLDVATGELVRFEQPLTDNRDTFVLDLSDRGAKTVTLPAVDQAIPATDIADLYPFPLE